MHNNKIKAKFFHGLSDQTRLDILMSLTRGDTAVGEIISKTNQSQPNVSNHLKCLIDCGLVANRREGRNVYYFLRDEKTQELLNLSDRVIEKVSGHIAACLNVK